MHEFQVHRPFVTPRSYQLKIGDEAIEAPMVSTFLFEVAFFICLQGPLPVPLIRAGKEF